MSLGPIERYNAFGKVANSVEAPKHVNPLNDTTKPNKSFGDVMTDVIKEVDQSHKTSNQMLEHLVTGDKPVTVHDAMIAMQKADVAFQLMNKVRAKIVRAYEEILRTPI
jgi:flagellar hook-basal body complex protein FliE